MTIYIYMLGIGLLYDVRVDTPNSFLFSPLKRDHSVDKGITYPYIKTKVLLNT